VSEVFPESPPSPPPATATPGQAARAAWNDHWAGPDPYPAGETQEETFERVWGDVAQAAISAQPPAAAPELAAAMAETRTVRDGYRQLCGEFGPSAQSGWSARISLTSLNRHRGRADLERFSRTESNQREDITLRYRRERDEAREQLAIAVTEARALRALAAEIIGDLEHVVIHGDPAYVDRGMIADFRERAGLDGDGG
jgi:hypothetical protein